jgi:hypothetical protein
MFGFVITVGAWKVSGIGTTAVRICWLARLIRWHRPATDLAALCKSRVEALRPQSVDPIDPDKLCVPKAA